MGSACSTPEVAEQRAKSRVIDRQLAKEKDDLSVNQKLLLLGTGECGKSTILKQIQILHSNGFSEQDLSDRKSWVYSNIITGMAGLIHGIGKFNQTLDVSSQEHARVVLSVVEAQKDHLGLPSVLLDALVALWKNPTVKAAFDRRNDINVSDSLSYFLDDLKRIGDENYRPTEADLLRVRIATTGVVQLSFSIKGCIFKVVDVGGQRSERKKWIHQFDDVNAIIFISAINEFDQLLAEDSTQNRLRESMDLFKNISASAFFTNSAMILFLNKKDLFLEKIQKIPLTVFFPKYNGAAGSYDDGVAYMKKMFQRLTDRSKPDKPLYIHETCATDTNQVQLVIDSVVDSIIGKNLRGTGIEM